MGKKRNRQPDVNDESVSTPDSEESGGDTSSGDKTCPHIVKAICLTKVRQHFKRTAIQTECGACKKLDLPNTTDVDEDEAVSMPPALWICLYCGNQACGRMERQHALEHYNKPHSDTHCLVADTHQWSVWCYICNKEINADSRKKLQECVEFLKKLATTSRQSPKSRVPPIPCQDEIKDEPQMDKDKQRVPCNLPKVGGLTNLGNTCFFNAVLQCLAQTPFLTKVLEDLREPGEKFILPGGKHKGAGDSEEVELPPIEGTLERWGSFTSVLCKTLTEMQNSNGHQTYRPSELLGSFKKKTLQCMDGGQHDSHELLRHLLELVRNEDLRRYQSIILKEVGLDVKVKRYNVGENLKSQVKFYGNQAGARLLGPELVFRGVLVSTVECLECHHSSHRTEPFLDLSLPVMADKPQPPILKRRNSGMDDTFDIMGNNVSNAPSKYQLKKEKKAARKNRKNKKHHHGVNNCNESLPDQNSIAEEKQGFNSESDESDADVEDNVEAESNSRPEVGESGYSSEKASVIASPVSPAGLLPNDQVSNSSNSNGLPIDGNLLPSPTDNSDSIQLKNGGDTNSLNTPSPTDVSMTDLTQVKATSEDLLGPSGIPSSLSHSKSLLIGPASPNSVEKFSKEYTMWLNLYGKATTSPLSSPITSKESPPSPLSSAIDGECTDIIERPESGARWQDLVEPELPVDDDDKDSIVRHTSRKSVPDLDTDELLSGEEVAANAVVEPPLQNCINDINSGLSRMSVSENAYQSPSRYHTKEGECSIQSCLNQFTALELMSGSNKVGCSNCTARENKGKEGPHKMVNTPSTKQYLISRAPAILILHLKRFQGQRIGFRKLTKHVSFPMVLDLAPVCKSNTKPKLYALYGVVEHSGTLHGGHYVAYVKARQPLSPNDRRWSFLPMKDAKDSAENSSASNSESESEEASARAAPMTEPPPGRWYYVSDSSVVEVDECKVLQSQAYLLFYERIY